MTYFKDIMYNSNEILISARIVHDCLIARGGEIMSLVKIKDNESLDNALRRFKRQCAKSGVLSELRKREHYEKPSVKRKKKSEAARKRKFA